MYQALKEFFEANPEAIEVHVALGFLHTDIEEAKNRLKGVAADNAVKTYTKEQFEAMSEKETPAPVIENKLVATFKKLPLDKMPAFIERQKEVVAKLEAGMKATDNNEKAEKALNFHDGILKAMNEAFEEKSKEEVK